MTSKITSWDRLALFARSACRLFPFWGDYDVTANLLTYFVFLLVLDMVFLIWPILLSRWEINKDLLKLKSFLGNLGNTDCMCTGYHNYVSNQGLFINHASQLVVLLLKNPMVYSASSMAGVPECWRGLWGTWRCFLFNSTMGGKEVQVHLWLMGWWSSDRFFGHHGVLLSCGLLGLYFADHRYAGPRCFVHFHASSDVQALALLVFAVGWGSGRDLFHLLFELVQVSLELGGFWIWSFRK